MEIVLGVSMTPTAVRLVLVEGDKADGVTVDHDTFAIDADDAAAPGAADQVIAAILGTRESAAEGGHRLVSVGVAWSDHAAAAELRAALRSRGISDVTMVSELHAASALAQAIGRAADHERTALIFVEDGPAGSNITLAVVQTTDGAVVTVRSGEHSAVPDMVASLESLGDPPQAVFVAGSGPDAAAVTDQIAELTTLPVHAPQDADLALARGAALASANTPRFEAETVGLASADGFETAAGATQVAPAGYMAPLGYSAVPDDPDGDVLDLLDYDADPAEDAAAAPSKETERKPFLLVGSALSTVFVVGVAALVISLAVSIRPTADQRPAPAPVPAAPSSQDAAPVASTPIPAPAPQTIQAPVPVVQVAPRTVYVTPAQRVPAPVMAPAPVIAPAPVAPVPEQVALAPEPAAPAPAPVAPPPIIPPAVVAPIIPPWLRTPVMPQFPNGLSPVQSPVQSNPVPVQTDTVAPAGPPATAPPQSPSSSGRDSSGRDSYGGGSYVGSGGSDGGRSRDDRAHRNPLWPEFPMPFG